jgi:hypothetical protein
MPTMFQHKPSFVLGGDRTAEEGKPLMHVADVLTGEDTFTIIAHSTEEVTTTKALHTPQIMKACFGNEERTKRVIKKHEEEEKMKADKGHRQQRVQEEGNRTPPRLG